MYRGIIQYPIFYATICAISRANLRQMVACFAVFYTMKWRKPFYALLSTLSPPLNNPKTTPSISKSNYSPPSSGNHRSLFVKPAKRGKQRAGGEASFASHHFTLYYQPRHSHNCFISQLGTSCASDSPGLARNEPTPGEHPQGDSTPSVLSFFYEGMLIMRQFMGINQKKRNTYGVVSHKPYANPG